MYRSLCTPAQRERYVSTSTAPPATVDQMAHSAHQIAISVSFNKMVDAVFIPTIITYLLVTCRDNCQIQVCLSENFENVTYHLSV